MPVENAVFKLADDILKFINEKIRVGRIFCDLAKAFDSVSHEIVLTTLQFYQGAKQLVQIPPNR
jgi:hypothetical protein